MFRNTLSTLTKVLY